MTVREDLIAARKHLIAARALVATPQKWARSIGIGKPKAGHSIYSAVVEACGTEHGWGPVSTAVDVLRYALPSDFKWVLITEFNDHPAISHADVIALFDRAIDACPTEEAA